MKKNDSEGATQIAPFFFLGGEMVEAEKNRAGTRIRQAPQEDQGQEDQESVAKSLIEKLGLYEELPTTHHEEENDGRGDVESE